MLSVVLLKALEKRAEPSCNYFYLRIDLFMAVVKALTKESSWA